MPDEAETETAAVVLCEEEIALLHWRVQRFLGLGFNLRQSRVLAKMPSSDWHRAETLLGHGCPVDLAFDVLS